MDVIMVRSNVDFRVILPEGVVRHKGRLKAECRERALEAVHSSLPIEIDIYLDGKDKKPARVRISGSGGSDDINDNDEDSNVYMLSELSGLSDIQVKKLEKINNVWNGQSITTKTEEVENG